MTTAGTPGPPDWKQLYQLAFVELDPVKLPQRISDARTAILNRIEDSLKNPGLGEQTNAERRSQWSACAPTRIRPPSATIR